MNKFFKTHPQATLVTLAVIFIGLIASYFVWGVGDLVAQVNRALNFAPTTENVGFDLQAASKLDLRGLMSTSTGVTSSTP